MKGRAGVLESEIKQDIIRGVDVEAKKEALAEMQQKAVQAETAQINILADANNELEVAAEEEKNYVNTNLKPETVSTDGDELADASVSETVSYTHVDVRL